METKSQLGETIKIAADPVTSDGRTVWVDGPQGTVGRFGVLGIDIHTVDTTACLHCTHAVTTADDWRTFVAGMQAHHGVLVGDEHKPVRFA